MTVTINPAASIVSTAGTHQDAVVGTAFATALQATVNDQYGDPVSGVSVTFAAPMTGPTGTFEGGTTTATAMTNSLGIATAPALTANTLAGSYTVTATVSGVSSSASFALTNTAGTAASVTATTGTPQSTIVGTAFGTALQATVEDQYGNPVSGVSVIFAAPTIGPAGSFGGSSTAIAATTNSVGVATAPAFIANTLVGSYTVNATVTGASAAAPFTLTNTAGAAASVTATAGTQQSAVVGTAFAAALQVTVDDKYGNPLDGVSVTFAAPTTETGGGFAGSSATTATTNSLGVATAPPFSANTLVGSYTVTATVTGVSASASFSLTNTAGAAVSITPTGGTPQSAVVGTAFATALQATVEDQYGNPVSGVSVTFAAPVAGPTALSAAVRRQRRRPTPLAWPRRRCSLPARSWAVTP